MMYLNTKKVSTDSVPLTMNCMMQRRIQFSQSNTFSPESTCTNVPHIHLQRKQAKTHCLLYIVYKIFLEDCFTYVHDCRLSHVIECPSITQDILMTRIPWIQPRLPAPARILRILLVLRRREKERSTCRPNPEMYIRLFNL